MINPLFMVNDSMIWHVVDMWIISSLKNGEWQYKPIVRLRNILAIFSFGKRKHEVLIHQMLGDKPCYFSQVTTGKFLMVTFRMKS